MKCSIIVLAFVGRYYATARWYFPPPLVPEMKARKLIIMKTYKFKMYSNHGNRELHKTIDGHAHVWNHCVALQRRYYTIYGKYISKFRLINHISKLKRLPKFSHWNQLPSQAIQDVAARIDKGYRAMFEARAIGKKWGRPRFKPRRKYKSFTLLQAGWKLLSGNKIRIGKYVYQYFKSRDVFGNPKRCTIKRDAIGDIYICILTDYVEPDLNRVMTGNSAGFDFGLKRYLTGHRGIGCIDCNEINSADSRHDIESPQFFVVEPQCQLTRRGSTLNAVSTLSNVPIATTPESVSSQRIVNVQDLTWHGNTARLNANAWKLAHELTNAYDEIRLEDLNLKGMKSLWGRKVSDLAFADFVKKLVYIAKRKGVKIKFIDKWYPSSKTCSTCGAVNEALNLRDRNWQCSDCGTTHDRDRNAAINIFRVGASTHEGEDVRGTSVPSPC